jgi:tetratricopeptide (TPR) repeat protein
VTLVFSPDGHRIVSGGIDYTARVWDATPLPNEVLLAQDALYQEKTRSLKGLRRGAGDALRAESLARDGQWALSAAALGKAVELEPNSLDHRRQHILSLMEAGARAGVRRSCEDLLKRFPKATDPETPLVVISCCVIAADAVADHEALVHLAESARDWADESVTHVLGAALYRAGRFQEAVRSLEKGIQPRGGSSSPQVWAFLAMAHHRLGHHVEAKRWLDELLASQPKEGADFSWEDVEIHRRRTRPLLAIDARENRIARAPFAPDPSLQNGGL